VFKDSVDSYYDCTVLAEYALEQGWTTFALFGAHAEFTENCKEALDVALADKGELLAYEPYPIGDRDYRTSLTKIRELKPDAVFLPSFSDDCIQIWKQIQELQFDTNYLLPFTQSGCGELKAMKQLKGFNPHVTGLEFEFDTKSKEYQQFITAFREKYDKEPTLFFFTMLGYDWAHYIAEAFEKCPDSSDDHCLRTALEQTDYDGVLGHVSYKPEHTTVRPRKLIEWKNEQWIDLR